MTVQASALAPAVGLDAQATSALSGAKVLRVGLNVPGTPVQITASGTGAAASVGSNPVLTGVHRVAKATTAVLGAKATTARPAV